MIRAKRSWRMARVVSRATALAMRLAMTLKESAPNAHSTIASAQSAMLRLSPVGATSSMI